MKSDLQSSKASLDISSTDLNFSHLSYKDILLYIFFIINHCFINSVTWCILQNQENNNRTSSSLSKTRTCIDLANYKIHRFVSTDHYAYFFSYEHSFHFATFDYRNYFNSSDDYCFSLLATQTFYLNTAYNLTRQNR